MASVKRFNWLPKPTAWETAQVWSQKRSANQEKFASHSAAAQAGFANASSNQQSGLAELTTRMASARITAAAQAKLNTLV